MLMHTPLSHQHLSAFSTPQPITPHLMPSAFLLDREARALQPLLQLLNVGSQLAGGERRAAIAALQASATALNVHWAAHVLLPLRFWACHLHCPEV